MESNDVDQLQDSVAAPTVIEEGETLGLSQSEIIDRIITPIVRQESSLSYSALSAFSESPKEFIKYKQRVRVTTDAMVFGSVAHCLVLEPQEFYKRYFVLDDDAKKQEIGGGNPAATNAFKGWMKEQLEAAAKTGKEVIKNSTYRAASAMANDVINNPAAARVLHICHEREVSLEWEYQNYKFRGFKDGSGPSATFDLKTVADANPRKVERDVWGMGYYIQAAMYNTGDGIPDKDYYIIAADQKGGVSVHQLKRELIRRGQREYKYLVSKFTECVLADRFDANYEFFADRIDGVYDMRDKPW